MVALVAKPPCQLTPGHCRNGPPILAVLQVWLLSSVLQESVIRLGKEKVDESP
jgi:hypothetical protein